LLHDSENKNHKLTAKIHNLIIWMFTQKNVEDDTLQFSDLSNILQTDMLFLDKSLKSPLLLFCSALEFAIKSVGRDDCDFVNLSLSENIKNSGNQEQLLSSIEKLSFQILTKKKFEEFVSPAPIVMVRDSEKLNLESLNENPELSEVLKTSKRKSAPDNRRSDNDSEGDRVEQQEVSFSHQNGALFSREAKKCKSNGFKENARMTNNSTNPGFNQENSL